MAEPNNSHTFNSPKGSKTSSNLESKPIDSHSSSSRPESSSTRAIRPPHAFYPHNHDTSINSSQHNNNLTNDHNNMDKYNTHIDRVSDSSSANETHHDSLDHSSSPHKLSNSYYSSSSQVSSDVSPNCDTSNASPILKIPHTQLAHLQQPQILNLRQLLPLKIWTLILLQHLYTLLWRRTILEILLKTHIH